MRNTLFAASVAFVGGFASFAQAADELAISSATPPQHSTSDTDGVRVDALIERSRVVASRQKVFDSEAKLCNAREP